MFNPVIAMLHNAATNRYHPIAFAENPLPGPPSPDKPVRFKSVMHHTGGFDTRNEAVAEAKGSLFEKVKSVSIGEPRLSLSTDLEWDGEGTPAMVEFFFERDGEVVPMSAGLKVAVVA